MVARNQSFVSALEEVSGRAGVSLERLAKSLGGINREQLPVYKNAISDPREEVILCYTVGTLRFVPFQRSGKEERFGILDMNLYNLESDLNEVNGRYRVIWKPEPVTSDELSKRPAGYTGPWDRVVEPIPPHLPLRANSHALYSFNGLGAIHATGPANLHLVSLDDGSRMFLISVATFITGGTGPYEGCSGVNTAMGSSFVPKGVDILSAHYGESIPGVTVSAFRVVRASGKAPPQADAPTVRPETVSRLLKKAAYFPLFSVPNPDLHNIPLPSRSSSNGLIGMKVFEQMHRFDARVEPSVGTHGLLATNRVGQPVADISIDWRVIPDDFIANPDVLPPPTELDPSRSQRFAMYNGHFKWNDSQGSSFRGFGAGRTFPTMVGGQPQLRIGAVVEILEGFGKLKGAQGNGVVNGFITPPNNLALNIMLRIIDPSRRFAADSRLTTLRPIPFPDPTATFLVFLGEPDPVRPITLNMTPDGQVTGASVHERLRLVQTEFDVATSHGMRTKTTDGPITGSLSFNLMFDSRNPQVPTPFQTTEAVFTFFDREERTIGTLNANIVEGRGFMTELAGVPPPVVRVVGFGPFLSGSGQFNGVSGMLSINGIISISARTPSILYVLRIFDPNGRFRRAWS